MHLDPARSPHASEATSGKPGAIQVSAGRATGEKKPLSKQESGTPAEPARHPGGQPGHPGPNKA